MKIPGAISTGVQSLGRHDISAEGTIGGAISQAVGGIAKVGEAWIKAERAATEADIWAEISYLDSHEQKRATGDLRDVPSSMLPKGQAGGAKVQSDGTYKAYEVGTGMYSQRMTKHLDRLYKTMTFRPSRDLSRKIRFMQLRGNDKVQAYHVKKAKVRMTGQIMGAALTHVDRVTADTRIDVRDAVNEAARKLSDSGLMAWDKAEEWRRKTLSGMDLRLYNDAYMRSKEGGTDVPLQAYQERLLSGDHDLDPRQEGAAYKASENGIQELKDDSDKVLRGRQDLEMVRVTSRQDAGESISNDELFDMADMKIISSQDALKAVGHNRGLTRDAAKVVEDDGAKAEFESHLQAYYNGDDDAPTRKNLERELLELRGIDTVGEQTGDVSISSSTYKDLRARIGQAPAQMKRIPGYTGTIADIKRDLAGVSGGMSMGLVPENQRLAVTRALNDLDDYIGGGGAEPRQWWAAARSLYMNDQQITAMEVSARIMLTRVIVTTDGKSVTEAELRSGRYAADLDKGEKEGALIKVDWGKSKENVLEMHRKKILGRRRHKILINELERMEKGFGR